MRFGEALREPQLPLTEGQEKICEWLFRAGGIEFGRRHDFKVHREYPDAPDAYVKINMEVLYGTEGEAAVTKELVKVIMEASGGQLNFQGVVGVPRGATGFAANVADYIQVEGDVRLDTLELTKKADGTFSAPELPESEWDTREYVLVEDVKTTGRSSELAAQALRDEHYRVAFIVAVVDREQGGANVVAGFTLRQLLWWGLQTGKVSGDDYDKAIQAERDMQNFLLGKSL